MEINMECNLSTIRFKKLGKKIEFKVAHDMEDFTFESALDCWIARTNEYTAESFCEYVKSKDSFVLCLPGSKLKNYTLKM